MKKLIIASTALGLVLSAAAHAQPVIEGGDALENSVANNGSTAFSDGNANAADGSIAVSGALNNNDLSDDNSVTGSNNVGVGASFNDNNSNNVSGTGNVYIGLDAEVAASDLEGEVANNAVDVSEEVQINGSNAILGESFADAAGISSISQNTAANAAAQQSVSIEATVGLAE